ncbi:hypothetical protein DICVIV_08078 [Dictyocaulus viviparus]|uniref:Uncharacterized protein n=1 Tax=Dictyocaulus viviparus TaxID=29172 RepID=A0A0D8XMN0_DICVI|nr:hypothetical protein DICVIV_08078 [Dictyocaulus viviparus]
MMSSISSKYSISVTVHILLMTSYVVKIQSATTKTRERNEELCAMERRTIDLNTLRDEFDPPFLVEVRCQNTADYERGFTDSLVEQACVHNLLRCVQRYGEVHVSRRPVGSVYWSPHTLRNVPMGCDCMWPVDRYGHQEL